MFLVPRDTPGFRSGKVFNKSGWRFYQNAELIFENARVPQANVIGQSGGHGKLDKGERTGGDLFGDLELAANALGVCMSACESALTLARSRTQGGKPLIEQQTVQLKIGRMNMLTEALRSYVMRVAWGPVLSVSILSNHSLASAVISAMVSCWSAFLSACVTTEADNCPPGPPALPPPPPPPRPPRAPAAG
jgi:alkylation response protein AidB-like acyl-CoA dehydrogenase